MWSDKVMENLHSGQDRSVFDLQSSRSLFTSSNLSVLSLFVAMALTV